MTKSSSNSIPKARFYSPERNLPGRKLYATTAETRFTIRFAKSYLHLHMAIHHRSKKSNIICARQVAINGFGIADVVSVSWESYSSINSKLSVDEFLKIAKPTVRAFEFKLTNWRKGLSQAHRYKYFSNASILVLPSDKSIVALKYLDTFKKVRVGLWGYNQISRKIIPHYTPRPSSTFVEKHRIRAVQIIANLTKALPIV